MQSPINVFWFRRDLRWQDNAGFYHALKSGLPVLPLFIFDRFILDQLEEKQDRRVEFIMAALGALQKKFISLNSSLEILVGFPANAFKKLLAAYQINTVFTNQDYEPYARKRDAGIEQLLKSSGASLLSFKDQVIFDRDEVIKDDGKPYTIFTPYSRRWKSLVTPFLLRSYPTERYLHNLLVREAQEIPKPEQIGFRSSDKNFPPPDPGEELIRHYDRYRDIPSVQGTSHLGVHLRFGTISIRELAARAAALNDTFLKELIWREFYQMICWHFPRVGEGRAFKPEYELIAWRNNEEEFARWCAGQTGYPIVDAGMRELNSTGFMHNRVRMIVASFLSKHLLIDWRWGEAYFASKLLDFDLASNNGGWQWAAGSGCDAAPYFRIFNPYLQTKKFDPDLLYIRQWIPELDSFDYPQPIVDHEFARKRALEVYGKALKE